MGAVGVGVAGDTGGAVEVVGGRVGDVGHVDDGTVVGGAGDGPGTRAGGVVGGVVDPPVSSRSTSSGTSGTGTGRRVEGHGGSRLERGTSHSGVVPPGLTVERPTSPPRRTTDRPGRRVSYTRTTDAGHCPSPFLPRDWSSGSIGEGLDLGRAGCGRRARRGPEWTTECMRSLRENRRRWKESSTSTRR